MSCLSEYGSPQSVLVPKSKQPAKVSKERPAHIKFYLFVYNTLNAVGWGYLFVYIIDGLLKEGTVIFSRTWHHNISIIGFLLFLVFGDAIHVLLGIITPNAEISVLLLVHCKVLRRLNLFGALFVFDQAQHNKYTGFMLLVWCSLDLIRFPFYALNTYRLAPPTLAEVRYFAELFLYPVSLVAEFLVWFKIFEAIVHSGNIIAYVYMLAVSGYLIWRLYSFPNNFMRMLRAASGNVTKKH
eukprot:Phypoly_transcript_11065.p1 GENE.Phypoly_transcript_11065~~Phypoly_transcript_11065.p1  ORF type:complete len:240 (+),score=22.36 Phypoly_transcript_11065:242-961(+)